MREFVSSINVVASCKFTAKTSNPVSATVAAISTKTMFTAARIALPVTVSVLVVIYKYFRSGQRSEFSEGAEVPLNPTSVPSPAPSDLEREILDWIRKLDPAVLNRIRNRDPALLHEIQQFDPSVEIRNFDPSIVDEIRNLDPAFPAEFSESVEKEKENEKERESEKSENSSGGGNENGGEVEEEVVEESSRRDQYPLRRGDCWYYLRTGNCKFGSNCKYNHPRITKNKQVSKDKAKMMEELEEKQDQTESKYYISPGRRIGVPSVAPALELNFSGLPIRPGEKDCPYYMQTATCKYETNCKFNHPDPTAAGESRPQSAYGNGRPASLQGLPNSQGINSETTEWNGYQAPAYLPHRSMPAPPLPPYVMNNSVTETNYYGQYAQQTQAEELPERPGQPVCFYFAQTGDCVYKSNCQYHHPKNQTAATPSCALSDRGLPLRPGQKICTDYSHFGVCSSGPTCRFDHPSLSDSFL